MDRLLRDAGAAWRRRSAGWWCAGDDGLHSARVPTDENSLRKRLALRPRAHGRRSRRGDRRNLRVRGADRQFQTGSYEVMLFKAAPAERNQIRFFKDDRGYVVVDQGAVIKPARAASRSARTRRPARTIRCSPASATGMTRSPARNICRTAGTGCTSPARSTRGRGTTLSLGLARHEVGQAGTRSTAPTVGTPLTADRAATRSTPSRATTI